MIASAYEKEADVNRYLYFVNFKSMSKVNYKFAGVHIHHSIEIVFCYSGELKAIINKKEMLLSSGDVLIINPLDWHSYEYINDASCFIIVTSKEYFRELVDDSSKEFRNVISLDENTKNELYDLCLKNCDKINNLSFIQKKAFVFSMFALIEKFGLFREKSNNSNLSICKKIISYIEEHYKENLSIGIVADEFGYSRNYFSSLFNDLIGENFTTFLNKYRASMVEVMRKDNPSMKVEEAIYAVGFNSRETYYRLLRKQKCERNLL